MRYIRLSSITAVLAGILSCAVPASAQEPFYKGKTINIIVQNMSGASGQTALMYMEESAPKDGTTIVTFNPGLLLQSVLTPDKVRPKFSEFSWLGSIAANVRVCYVWHTTGIKTIEDMINKDQLFMGVTGGGGGTADIDQRILRKVLGVKVKQVSGYEGGAQHRLALERGELDGDCIGSSGIPVDWLRDKLINVVVRMQDGQPSHVTTPLPYVGDLVTDPVQKKLLELLSVPSELGRPFVVLKSVPADRTKILAEAFAKTVIDPEFVADSDKVRQEISAISGMKLQQMIDAMGRAPQAAVEAARQVMAD